MNVPTDKDMKTDIAKLEFISEATQYFEYAGVCRRAMFAEAIIRDTFKLDINKLRKRYVELTKRYKKKEGEGL